jgi:hypothetical protein
MAASKVFNPFSEKDASLSYYYSHGIRAALTWVSHSDTFIRNSDTTLHFFLIFVYYLFNKCLLNIFKIPVYMEFTF